MDFATCLGAQGKCLGMFGVFCVDLQELEISRNDDAKR